MNGKGDRSKHEEHCRNCGRAGEGGGCAARAECRLAALSTKGGGDVTGFAALQQNDDDQKQANDHMDDGDKDNKHGI